jgi:TMEM175 potassium channel family protein
MATVLARVRSIRPLRRRGLQSEEAAQAIVSSVTIDPSAAAAAPRETSRLETFADGVFAIAITLLVLEIHIPETGEDLAHALPALWPSFAAYVTSFLSIGVMWVSHHGMFTLIARTTPTFLFLNVLLLLPVAFIPYTTALVAQHIQEPDARTIAVLAYGGVSVAIALMFNVLWAYAYRRGLLARRVDRVNEVARAFVLGPAIYLVITLVALFNPFLSMAGFAALAIFWMLPGRIPTA